jgi:hypothetical protein
MCKVVAMQPRVQHHEKVAGGEVRRGGAIIWWKKCFDRKGAARWRRGGLLEVGEMGRSNWEKIAPLAKQIFVPH